MNGVDTYQVPPKKMNDVASRLEQAATSLETKINDLDGRLNKIYPVWHGLTPAEYATKFSMRMLNLRQILAEIRQLASFLKSAAARAKAADKKGQTIGVQKR